MTDFDWGEPRPKRDLPDWIVTLLAVWSVIGVAGVLAFAWMLFCVILVVILLAS